MKQFSVLFVLILLISSLPVLACEPVAADRYYTIGDEVRFGDGIITIHGISYNEIYGDKVITLDVSVRNVGETEISINDLSDMDIYDQDGFSLRMSPNPKARGDRLTTDLRPGRVIRAEMAFHVGEQSKEYLFDYRYDDPGAEFKKNVVTFYLGNPGMSDEERRDIVDKHNERFGH